MSSPAPISRFVTFGPDQTALHDQLATCLGEVALRPRDLPGARVSEGEVALDRATLIARLDHHLGNWRDRIAILPDDPIKLVAFDVDSTLVNGEVIDMIADHMGVGEKVARVTQAAMEGHLDFNQSLHARVALLEGCSVDEVIAIHDRLSLNPYAKELIGLLHDAGIATMMVSGGFTLVTDLLAQDLGMVACHANTLEVEAGKLTGKVTGEIINAQAKRHHVLAQCGAMGIAPSQAVCVGDGANDLVMMEAVAMGVAYNAKPIVQAQADVALNEPSLAIIAAVVGA